MNSPTIEALWAHAQPLLDARAEPLADAPFARAYADALGAALEADDATALAELDALLATLDVLRAAPERATPAPPLAPKRFPWLAALAASLLMLAGLASVHAPAPPVNTLASSAPQVVQPAHARPRIAIKRLDLDSSRVAPVAARHANIKRLFTTSKRNP